MLTTSPTKASGDEMELKVKEATWESTPVDPAVSEQRWSQFTKHEDSPLRGAPKDLSHSPRPVDSQMPPLTATQMPPLTATQHIFAPAAPVPPPSPSLGSGGLNKASSIASSSGAAPLPSPPAATPGVGVEPTILYPVGTGANGAPLFMALTPSQLASVGGNPQSLLHGATLDLKAAPPGPPPMANPGFTNPFGMPLSSLPPPPPSGVQLVMPPGMSVPIPVPITTMQVKAAVGVPAISKHGNPPAQYPARTPQGPTPVLHSGKAATPSFNAAPGPVKGSAPVLLAMTPGQGMVKATTPPTNAGPFAQGRPPTGDPSGEQLIWAAHEHIFAEQAPTLNDVRSLGTSGSSNTALTPLAFSGRANGGLPLSPQTTANLVPGRPSNSNRSSPVAGGRKFTKQEMLLQQLQANPPSTVVSSSSLAEGATDAEHTKWSTRAELEERLVGKKEDAATPMAHAASASTPVAAWKAKVCKAFLSGSCKYGDKCVFSHPASGDQVSAGSIAVSSSDAT